MEYRSGSGAATPHVGLRMPVDRSFAWLCLQTGGVLECDDSETDARVDRDSCRRVGARSMILVPIRREGTGLGVLKVFKPRPHGFCVEDGRALQLMARFIESAVRHAEEFEAKSEALRALQESEARFTAAFHISTVGMSLMEIDGRFFQANQALCDMLGYSKTEMAARNFQAVTHPDDLKSSLDRMQQVLTGSLSSFQIEERYLHKGGHTVWGLISTSLLQSVDGEPLYFLTQIQNIDATKRAQAALAESHELLQAVMENTTDSVFAKDRDGRILLINDAGARLIGKTRAEILGKAGDEFITAEAAQRIRENDRLVLATGQTQTFEEVLQVSGRQLILLSNRCPLRDAQGRITGVVGIARDITRRKQMEEDLRRAEEEARRANQAKSELLSRISHELRTPLNAILGFTQLLEMDTSTPSQKESVEQILKAGRHLLQLINEVLEITRIERGRLSLSVEPVDVAEVVAEACALVQPLADERSITIDLPGDSRAGCHAQTDRQRLKQVLVKLLSNAVKYNCEGGSIQLTHEPAAVGVIRITVADTGPGIPAEKLDRLFTPFDRLDAEQAGIEGAGLGLALCRHLIEALGGSLDVETAEGMGCRFWIDLPGCADGGADAVHGLETLEETEKE